jgi:protein ImuA
MKAGALAILSLLRREVAKIEGQPTNLNIKTPKLTLGVSAIDHTLQGGLAPASLHEIEPARVQDFGAAIGFALALAARSLSYHILWIQTDFATLEAGSPYGPGCDLFGLDTRRFLILKVPRSIDALWAMEEALKSGTLGCVIAELPGDVPLADLKATRRMTIAAREGRTLGFLLRHCPSPLMSSAETRWEVTAARSYADRFGGLGRTAFLLALVKNRRGPTGRWTIAWDHHERAFSTLSFGVAQAAFDRSRRTPLGHSG